MICNIDKSWTLEPKDVQDLNLWVALLLKERAESPSDKSFDPNRFIKYIYDQILDATKDEQKALAFAREVPSGMLLTTASFPEIRKGLKAKGYNTSQVEDLQDRFSNSLQDVANMLSEFSASNAQSQVNALNNNRFVQPQEIPNMTVIDLPDETSDLPATALSTTGRDTEERRFYYDFIKNLKKVLIKQNSVSADGSIAYVDVPKGIRLAAITGKDIPFDQLYADEKQIPDIAERIADEVYIAVTNNNGDYVYFDENFKVTTADKGKLVYFPIRTIPSFTVKNGKRVFNLAQVEGKSIRPISELSKTEDEKDLVYLNLQNQYNTLQNVVEHVKANPGDRLLLSFSGIDQGTINYSTETETPLSQIANLGDIAISISGDTQKAFKYIRIPGVESKVRMVMGPYSTEMAQNVANLLLRDVYLPNGKKMSISERINLIAQFTHLSKTQLSIDPKQKKIFIEGTLLDTTDKEAAAAKIVEHLTRKILTKIKNKEVQIPNQFYFSNDIYTNKSNGGMVNLFILTQRPDGSFDYSPNNVSYKEWLKNNAFVTVKTDDNGNISERNGYFTFTLTADTAKKVNKDTAGFAQEREQAGITPQKKVTPVSASLPTTGKIAENLQQLLKNKYSGRLFSMRHDSYDATKKQIEKAEKWFNSTVITYKDTNGKVVSAKLSEVVPLKVLFDFANAGGDIRAEWTRAGITLFNGSDYTDLYHEAWHAFSQLFMTPDERKTLYNAVKSLGRDIKYYDHKAGSWKTINSADLDFSIPEHMLYAEEFLADEYKEYAKNKGTVTGTIKAFFKRLFMAIKALFTGSSLKQSYNVPVLKEAFDNLHVGNLINYTFDQQNIGFNVLRSGITAIVPKENQINTIDVSTALDLSESMVGYISEFVDSLNTGEIFGTGNTSVFTYRLFSDPEMKKLALTYARDRFEQDRGYFESLLENASEFEKLRYNRIIEELTFAIDNFGNIETPETKEGLLGFFNKRTGLSDISLLSVEEEAPEASQALDADGNPIEGNAKDGSSPFVDDNSKSAWERVDPVMKFIFSSLNDREEGTANNPQGLKANRILGAKMLDPKTAFNVISSLVTNLSTKEEMYDALWYESEKTNALGFPTKKALIVKQFLQKIGTTNASNLESILLWNKTYHSLRYDRLEGVQVIIEKSDSGLSVKVGASMGATKSLERIMNNMFLSKNPSRFAKKDMDGIVYLDLNALKSKYEKTNMRMIERNPDKIFELFKDFGIELTPSLEAAKRIIDENILQDLWRYNFSRWLNYPNADIRDINDLIRPRLKGDNVPLAQDGVWKRLLNIEATYNIYVSDEMILDSKQNRRSEKFSPSSASTIINQLNKAGSYDAVIADDPYGILDVYNIRKNPRVKTSQIFQKMFGKNLQERQTGRNRLAPVSLELKTILGTQLVEKIGPETNEFIAGLNSADSDVSTAYVRDFFNYTYTGFAEAYKHADKQQAYVLTIQGGDPGSGRYVPLWKFKTDAGRNEANEIILDYIGSELEFIRKTQQEYVTGENPQDVIIGKTNLKEIGKKFVTFDDILTDDTKAALISREDIQTVEDFRSYLSNNPTAKMALIKELDNYFAKVIEIDAAKLASTGLVTRQSVLRELGRKNLIDSSDTNLVFQTAVANFVYSSFIHKYEMDTFIYGDPVFYDHNKDEHMKRVPLFFATGKTGLSDRATDIFLTNNPGKYHNSEWFKRSGLSVPESNYYTNHTMNVAVLEDPVIESPYFNYYVKIAVNRGLSKAEAEKKYAAYKDIKIADGFAYMTIDAYRALEMSYDNWSPQHEALYNNILNNKEVDEEEVAAMFPVKKLQYSGWLKTLNLPLPAGHKFAVAPLIPTVIKNTSLEILHNKMVSQQISYAVFQSGSKIVSIGKDGALSKFYTQKSNQEPAFAKSDYTFNKNVIYKPFLKEQVKSDNAFKRKISMPTQLRKVAISGISEYGCPVDFKTKTTDPDKRIKAWEALSNTEKKEESTLYRLEEQYLDALDKMLLVSKQNLEKELGYSAEKGKEQTYNLTKLVSFFKTQLDAQDVSEYDLDFIKIGSTGELELPLDLSTDPGKIEKLIVSLANKRVYKHMVNGDSFVQVPVVGYEKLRNATEADNIKYGNRGLKFYTVDDVTGKTRAMEVKVPIHGQFFKLLKLQHNDGEQIGTLTRLNDMIKNPGWLEKGDNKKMITMIATRIPTQEENFIDVMQIVEFLPPSAGPIVVLPEEIVAKNGSDYDIDKMYILKPVIKDNRGQVEYVRSKATKKTLDQIVKEKAEIKEVINSIYDDYNEYIDETKKQKIDLTDEQAAELNAIRNTYRKPINDLRKEQSKAYDKFLNDPNNLVSDYQEVEEIIQNKIDALIEEESKVKREFFKKVFSENFLNETLERRNKELEVENEKLRELNREALAFNSFTYQNDMMEALVDILLSPEYFLKLTSATDTSFFTDPGEVVGKFTKVNRQFRKTDNLINIKEDKEDKEGTEDEEDKKTTSPTRIKENNYNHNKAEAVATGKGGIGMVATDLTFYGLAKKARLTMSPEYTAIDKNGKPHLIKQFLLMPHNTLTVDGEKAITLSGATSNKDKSRQVSQVLSQIANGYLEIAKNDFLYDVNIVKELETEAALLLEQGVDLQDVVAMLSQPLVREYLKLAKELNSPVKVATGDIANTKFAKYQALMKVLQRFAPEYVTGKDPNTGDAIFVNVSTASLVSAISNKLYDDYVNDDTFSSKELIDRSKKVNLSEIDEKDVKIFLHFVQINQMAKEYSLLKYAFNFDTVRSSSVIDVLNRRNKMLALSNAFTKDSIQRLSDKTVLRSFINQSIIVDASAKLLPLRSNPAITKFALNAYSSIEDDAETKEKQIRNFINSLPEYVFQNYSINSNISGNTYESFTSKTNVEVKPQALLKFGAFVDPETGDLLIDELFIRNQFYTAAFATDTYGQEASLAKLPSDTFSNYRTNAYNAYKRFVIEREIARYQYPYSTILENGEFALFNAMRNNSDMSLPDLYEEFIRNKGLENAMIDSAILKSNTKLGIFSYGDQYRFILGQYQISQNYTVLDELVAVYDPSNNSRFLTTRTYAVDGMQQTAYKSQIKRLADPAERKVSNQIINDGISAFFAKMSMVGFIQAGNNPTSPYYLGNIVDNSEIAQYMKPGLDAFIKDMENPDKAEAILADYKLILDAKGTRTYHNFSSTGVAEAVAQPSPEYIATETARSIYAKLGNKTQSENVEIPGKGDLKDVTYSSKTFWSEVVPEARAWFGDQIIIAYRGKKTNTFLQNYKGKLSGEPSLIIGNPFDWQNETGTRDEQGIKSTKRFIHWMITGDNMGVSEATPEYRQAIIDDIKNGKLKNRHIIYYQEKGYATHATALDYLINKYDWSQSSAGEVPTTMTLKEYADKTSAKFVNTREVLRKDDIEYYNDRVNDLIDGRLKYAIFALEDLNNKQYLPFINKLKENGFEPVEEMKYVLSKGGVNPKEELKADIANGKKLTKDERRNNILNNIKSCGS